MNIKKFFGSRKFKYGSVAIVLSVVFVALVLVFNVMLTVIGQKYSIYADLTTEEFYTVSESSKAQLEGVDLPVEIVFFQKREDIPDPTQTANALGYVKYLAEEYKKSFDFVDVKYIDMVASPAAANAYRNSTNDTIRNDSVVIVCPATGKKKIIQIKGFFTFQQSGELYGFNGEKVITSNILQVANTRKSKAYFTTGHDEFIGYMDANGNARYTYILDLLAEQGYEIGAVDLATGDIPADADLVIINQPTKDFAGYSAEEAGGTNEIEKIKNYIQKDYGDVMVVLSSSAKDLPELREVMQENFGIAYVPQTVLSDTTANTVGSDGGLIITRGAGENTSFEYQMHKSVTEKGIKIIAPYSVPLQIVGNADKYTAPVIVSSPESKIVGVAEDGGAAEMAAPNVPVVAISSKISYDENQNEKRGSLLVVGSALIFEEAIAKNSAYGNTDFFYGILKSLGNKSIVSDIPTKPFSDNYLDITKKDANTMTVFVTALFPLILVVLGTVVWFRRKRK